MSSISSFFKACLPVSFLCFLITVSCNQKQPESEVEYHKNPGYYEQWLEMKKDENGKIPTGLQTEWHKADLIRAAYKRKQKTGLVNFKEIGPDNIGGRTHDILIDLADENRVFAASSSGGLWISKNNGKKWIQHDDWSSSLAISSLAQNWFNPKEIYYSTGIAAGGAGLPGIGIFKSIDGGEIFTQIDTTSTFGNIWDIEYSLTDSHTLYVGTATKGLIRTTDGGKTFEQLINGGAVTDIEVFPNGSVLAAITSNGIFYSVDGSAGSFKKINNGTPSGGFNRLELAKCDSFPNVVYANFTLNVDGSNGRNIGIWKSSNGGKTWALVSDPLRSPGDIFAQPWFSLALAVDPLDSQKLITGCRYSVFSKNGGKTWSPAKSGHPDYMVYTFRRDRPGHFYSGNDGGIYEHNWETVNRIVVNKNNSYNVTQYYAGSFMPDSLGNIAGAQDNGTNFSDNGIASYYEYAMGGDGAFCHLHQQVPKVAYMSSQNGALRKTENIFLKPPITISATNELDSDGDGNIDDGAWFINPFEMNYENSQMVFFPTRRRLWFSYDGAGSWYPLTGYKSNLYCVGIPNNSEPYRIYVGGDNMQLYRIDDLYSAEPGTEVYMGQNRPNGLTQSFISNITVHPRHDNIIYLSLSNYSSQPRIWRIEDAETEDPTWVNISGDLPERLPVNWMVVDPYRPDSFFIAATDFGLYTSQNGGENWVKEDRLPNVMVSNLRLRYSDRKLFIFTYGRGVFTADLEKMEDPFMSVETPKANELSVYPSPASDIINIDIEEAFNYEVFDLSGKMVSKGNSVGQIDIAQLSKGTYSIVVNANEKTFSSRFVKE